MRSRWAMSWNRSRSCSSELSAAFTLLSACCRRHFSCRRWHSVNAQISVQFSSVQFTRINVVLSAGTSGPRDSLFLRFNVHFPGEPRLAGVYWSKGWWRWWVVTTGAIGRAKLQSNHHHKQTNTQFFTGRMPLLSPNQQCQSTEGKNITFHGSAYLKLTWGSSNFVSDH